MILIDITGWIGSILLIVAYWLNSQNKLSSQSLTYQILNVVGSMLLMVNTLYYGAYPSSALNLVWVTIGVIFLIKNYKK